MKERYIIKQYHCSGAITYYNKMFHMNVDNMLSLQLPATQFMSMDDARNEIISLPLGTYEIIKIYIKE